MTLAFLTRLIKGQALLEERAEEVVTEEQGEEEGREGGGEVREGGEDLFVGVKGTKVAHVYTCTCMCML